MENNKSNKISNSDVVLISIFLTLGDEELVDIEDVYLKCFEIYPTPWVFRTNKKMFYTDGIRRIISKLDASGLVIRNGANHVRLSDSGISWINKSQHAIDLFSNQDLSRINFRNPGNASTNIDLRVIINIKNSDFYSNWISSEKNIKNIQKWEIAEALRLTHNTTPQNRKIWNKKLSEILAACKLQKEQDIEKFLEMIQKEYPEWF